MNQFVYKLVGGIFFVCLLIGAWFVYSELYSASAVSGETRFDVREGESVSTLAARLEQEHTIRYAWLFRALLRWKEMDTDVKAGTYTVTSPVTIARIVAALASPETTERTITIIPGWDARDIATYVETEGIGSRDELYRIMGAPASSTDGLEGYLAPDTYRVYKNASLDDIVSKLVAERNGQLTDQMKADIEKSGHTLHEILTMASILEREVRGEHERAMVADIFWRRLKQGWALQADSTVHYVVGKEGSVFTTAADRQVDSPWNTYKYPGLPPAPISNPSLESIMAAIYPEKNEYWYFLTDNDGVVHYAKTNDEHNVNRAKYLR